jgi:hypothetical protein
MSLPAECTFLSRRSSCTDAILRAATSTTADELFLRNVLWTYEACFTREGVSNVHASYVWARDDPHAIGERVCKVHFSVSVSAGIDRNTVAVPYLLPLPARLTAERYCDFLETVLPRLLEEVPLAVRQRLWFHHDGVPAHYGEDIQQWLNATYPERWIGRGGQLHSLLGRRI